VTSHEAAFHLAVKQFEQAERILLVSHIRPDGDAVGSLIGLGLALQQAGRDVQMVIDDGISADLRYLEGSRDIRRRPVGEFDLVCTLDCSDLTRTGVALAGRPICDINIDHHATNLNFANINLIDTQAVATAEIVADLLFSVGIEMTYPVATALMYGLLTDTIGFRTANVSPKSLRLTADLLETGVDMAGLYRRALTNRSFEAARFWGSGLNKLKRLDRMVYTSLTLADRQEAHYPGRDDADLINILSSIEDTDISLVFVEQSDGHVKVSWRAQPGFDVSKVAMDFGGGGHAAASGAEIRGSLSEVQAAVIEKTRPLMNGGHRVE